MESQVKLNEERNELLGKLGKASPDTLKGIHSVVVQTYQDGILSAKTKRLMSLAVALGAGCRNCILAQTEGALEEGATTEEIFETISVAISMRGTTGVGESLRVVKFLEELGKL